MNLTEVKECLYDAAARFFSGAVVIWAEQIGTRPEPPYVTIRMGGIHRTAFPIDDGSGGRSYPCSTTAEVNLYTRGCPLTEEGADITGNYINTATADLIEFSNFLESDSQVEVFAGYGMDVSLMPPVRDLTFLQNDSSYRYRAMAEYMITFVAEAGGRYGLSGMPMVPNSSGGGTAEMAAEPTGVIEKVDIGEEKEEEDEKQSIG